MTGRSKRGVTLWLLLAAACDCGQSHSAPDGSVDATSPEPDGGRVVAEGCDDPELWAVSPTEELELTVGGAAGQKQRRSDSCGQARVDGRLVHGVPLWGYGAASKTTSFRSLARRVA